ncbi:MAG: GatB/YqeY domain-containing protein, partial [Gemmatimonadetes bacterium]|nr:GatB/YqeY domain-containing protein [Gemmatimonadota bacterium]
MRGDQVAARKAADKDRTLLLGTVLAALKNRELEGAAPLTDAEVVDVLRKQIKQRRDSVEQYTAAGRDDLAGREQAELEALAAYLPPEA